MAHLRAMIVVFAALLFCLPASAEDSRVNAYFDGPSLDLFPYLQAVETDKQAVSVELPSDGTSDRVLMQLTAVGRERVHRWAVLTLTNPDQDEQALVILTPFQGFVSSGVIWPKPSGSRIENVIVAGTAPTRLLPALGADALEVRLAPSSMTTFAFELTPAGLDEMTLWKRAVFESRENSLAFFRGVVLGIALLMALAMLALFAVRFNAVFPFAALFALASTGFIALEVGYLAPFNAMLPAGYRMGGEARAIVEGLMLTGLILCLVSFVDLRKRWPAAGNALLALGALSLALPVYGWFEPAIATGIERIGFALVAAGGFIVVLALWRDGVIRAQASLLSWSLIVLWTFAAAVAALTPVDAGLWMPALISGLVLILLTMGFALAQLAFGQGFIAQRLFEESGRRALALAGSQQYVWDWQVDDRTLHVGEELEKSLGLVPGTIGEGGPEGWLDLVHPSDRKAYIVAIESAERRGHGAFSLEFRLRRGDGTYRWFNLRGRVMPGSDRRPLRCIGTLTDVTGARRAQEQLLNDAVYDRVTGLPNRALLADRTDRAIAAIEEGQQSELYLLVIDLDRFTAVNDGLGYETGDGLLNITGRRLAAVASHEDTVARMPGDQFAVLFSGKGDRDVIAFTDHVRKAVSRPISMRTQEIFLTASLGIAAYREKGQTAEDLLKDAAIALYEAKRRGKDTVEFFRTSMRDDRSELVALESELRRALERNEIEVLYQPIARLADMDLAGFEALMRWRHRTFGLLGPEAFLAVAETTGIIRDLGRFVLNDAARNLGIWQRAFRAKEPLFVAVNISSSQLIGTELIDEVKSILGREGIQRDTLKVEITESMVMQNPELAVQVLDRLKQMGVGLACDDFGTGYSSLSNLRRLPFDTLKVDRSFIEPEPSDDKAAIILEAVLLLAHELGLSVVAEGIQSQEHVDRLGELYCDMGQGNFIGEPMTAKQVVDALSGLPYAASRNKSVIAALWERVSGSGSPAISPPPSRQAAGYERASPPYPPAADEKSVAATVERAAEPKPRPPEPRPEPRPAPPEPRRVHVEPKLPPRPAPFKPKPPEPKPVALEPKPVEAAPQIEPKPVQIDQGQPQSQPKQAQSEPISGPPPETIPLPEAKMEPEPARKPPPILGKAPMAPRRQPPKPEPVPEGAAPLAAVEPAPEPEALPPTAVESVPEPEPAELSQPVEQPAATNGSGEPHPPAEASEAAESGSIDSAAAEETVEEESEADEEPGEGEADMAALPSPEELAAKPRIGTPLRRKLRRKSRGRAVKTTVNPS